MSLNLKAKKFEIINAVYTLTTKEGLTLTRKDTDLDMLNGTTFGEINAVAAPDPPSNANFYIQKVVDDLFDAREISVAVNGKPSKYLLGFHAGGGLGDIFIGNPDTKWDDNKQKLEADGYANSFEDMTFWLDGVNKPGIPLGVYPNGSVGLNAAGTANFSYNFTGQIIK